MPSAERIPITSTRSKTHWLSWVVRSPVATGCSDYPPVARANLVVGGGLALHDLADRFPVPLTGGHDRPDDARGLVGEERDRSDLGRAPCQQLHQPRPAGAVPLRIADHHQRANDQHLPQVAMTLL